MTGVDFVVLLLLFTIAVGAAAVAIWMHGDRIADLEKGRKADAILRQALEDRVAMLEIPEITRQAEQRHLLAQSLLRRGLNNGAGGGTLS